MGTTPEQGTPSEGPAPKEHPSAFALDPNEPTSEKAERKPEKKPARGRRKKAQAPVARRYPLRSSFSGGVRVLRSRPEVGKKEAPPPLVTETSGARRRGEKKQRGATKRGAEDEFARMRMRVAYYLRRMNYEHSLVDAYASEGWKGLSLEKIRPEKELERAKSEIIRCKAKIRDLFQQLDSLLLEGRLDDSLFDMEGQIDSEDIFCAKCGSKDLSTGNDIILCDGACNRGFHQKCLIPPLLNEDIPSGDEGWLCPICDCKVECIDLVNELQGSDLSIEDNWEKIFPEAASTADGKNAHDDLGLPSDDSEDEDFAPNGSKVHSDDVGEEESDSSSSSEDSDFTSEDSSIPNNNLPSGDPGLPSDDSEDDDYDPDKVGMDNRSAKDGTGSDFSSSSCSESDFSSDSEGSGALCYNNEIKSNSPKSHPHPGGVNSTESSVSAKLLSLKESDMGHDDVITSLGRRKWENVGHKHNDSDKISASDSDDEDETWTGNISKKSRHEGPVKVSSRKKTCVNKTRCKSGMSASVSSNMKIDRSASELFVKSSTRTRKKQQSNAVPCDNSDENLSLDTVNKKTSLTKLDHVRLENATADPSLDGRMSISGLNSPNGSIRRYLGKEVSEKLLDSFKGNQYPTSQVKKNLSEQLGITYKQVNRWFGNARHNFRASANSPRTPMASNSQSTAKRGRKVKCPGTNGLEKLSLISTGRNDAGSQQCSTEILATVGSASKTLDLKDRISSQTAGKKSKGVSSDREKLVLRELRKLKRSH